VLFPFTHVKQPGRPTERTDSCKTSNVKYREHNPQEIKQTRVPACVTIHFAV
jgi:hypothetical protein